MSREIYILNSQVHFGSLKTSVPKGTKIYLDRDSGMVEINGATHDNVGEIDICIRAGYVIPFIDGETVVDATVKISPKALEKQEKMEVQKSDMDMMPNEIDISSTKKEARDAKRKEKMTVSYENNDEADSRGLKVVKNESATGLKADTDKDILKVVNGDDYQTIAKIDKAQEKKASFGLSTTDDAKDIADAVNGQEGTVVAKIGKGKADTKSVGSGKALVAKHASKDASDKAKATAEARKKAIESRRAKETK